VQASAYGRYIAEREGYQIVENEAGFMTFIITGATCYIRDMYVEPEFRRTREGTKLADQVTEIARKLECKYLLGSVNPKTIGKTASNKALLYYGFELLGAADDGLIYFQKEI
jgi:GNAT superfamily N-acetyltransferase